jgi:ubiquinone/menaquinone biosynthesis C-methylase UbiE
MKNRRIITGNFYNKYQSRHPIERFLVKRYDKYLGKLVESLPISTIYEVGSGEGHIIGLINNIKKKYKIIGSDIDFNLIHRLKRLENKKYKLIINEAENLPFKRNSIDLVLACEVLEHIPFPELFLYECLRINANYYIFTIPNEPLWRFLNILRLKYIKNFGNTPGHVNHWSKNQIRQLISSYLSIKDVFIVQPWIFIIAQPKDNTNGLLPISIQ